jgi:hypothetical protein
MLAQITQIIMPFAITVDLAAILSCLVYQRALAYIIAGSVAQRGFEPGIKTTEMHPQHSAHRPDRKFSPVPFDKRVLHRDSLAKYAVAFSRMSRSSVTRARSRLTRRNSDQSTASSSRILPGFENCAFQV